MNVPMNAFAQPILSCIVAAYNAEKTLPILLESLKKQDLQDVEIIIQDGGSKDGTLAILDTWRNAIPNLKIYSAPDKGIYDAWNKALEHVQGQWVHFLGADDTWVCNNSVSKAVAMLKALPDDAIYLATPVAVVPHSGDRANLESGSLLHPLVPVDTSLSTFNLIQKNGDGQPNCRLVGSKLRGIQNLPSEKSLYFCWPTGEARVAAPCKCEVRAKRNLTTYQKSQTKYGYIMP